MDEPRDACNQTRTVAIRERVKVRSCRFTRVETMHLHCGTASVMAPTLLASVALEGEILAVGRSTSLTGGWRAREPVRERASGALRLQGLEEVRALSSG
ncbi:hypothetical protein MRX96_000724 [Rhipicephalus microplus]